MTHRTVMANQLKEYVRSPNCPNCGCRLKRQIVSGTYGSPHSVPVPVATVSCAECGFLAETSMFLNTYTVYAGNPKRQLPNIAAWGAASS